jgi:hypothetical protein
MQRRRRRSFSDTGSLLSGPQPSQTCVGGRDGRHARCALLSPRCRTPPSSWRAPSDSCSPRISRPPRRWSLQRPALLPTLDPTTMGWKERDWYLGPHAPILFEHNGNAGPTVWWEGRVVGGWSQRRDGEIVFRLLEDVGGDAVRAVETEAERLAEWLGDVRFAPGFLPPFQRELAAKGRGLPYRLTSPPSGGRSPGRSRAAGSATYLRRSGRASRRA